MPESKATGDELQGGGPVESTELRKVGLKVTHPRIRILQILDSNDRHLSAEDIYRRLLDHEDDIGLATVYRVLTQFEAAGLVLKHNFEGGQAVYELDRGKHHDHMVDIDTGKVIEFTSEEIERLQHEIAATLHCASTRARMRCTHAPAGACGKSTMSVSGSQESAS
jgi:Fur family ferric uptake transcriptional regulator